MEEKKKSKFKNFIESISRPFKALVENDDEKEIQIEIDKLKNVQSKLKINKDYKTNISYVEQPKAQTRRKQEKTIGEKSKNINKDFELDM